ncbi:MAG TPA: SMC-Scp complex subunit ScpB [Methylocella sp.]|nr:SMC-Scp complex subunit ScpB [Methylocella sp.]
MTPTELLALAAIAYLQPVTRAEISRLAGKDISRDVIARLKLRSPSKNSVAYITVVRSVKLSSDTLAVIDRI